MCVAASTVKSIRRVGIYVETPHWNYHYYHHRRHIAVARWWTCVSFLIFRENYGRDLQKVSSIIIHTTTMYTPRSNMIPLHTAWRLLFHCVWAEYWRVRGGSSIGYARIYIDCVYNACVIARAYRSLAAARWDSLISRAGDYCLLECARNILLKYSVITRHHQESRRDYWRAEYNCVCTQCGWWSSDSTAHCREIQYP